ncbi:MAG TPA: CorA family divalent cation transporter [Phycisphaerales bacterium]|nr:CorA family divalent cation transporter [Phycisphaerales bacterium]
MTSEGYMLQAAVLDGRGGARALNAGSIGRWTPDQGLLWAVLDRHEQATEPWLRDVAALPELLVTSILTEEPRPRCTPIDSGLLVMLRGVNLIPGAEPDDMVALRGWFDERRAILVRGRPVTAVDDVAAALQEGNGPTRSGEILVQLLEALTDRIDDTAADLSEQADEIEAKSGADEIGSALRVRIAELRSGCMTMRRHIAPQRDMVGRMIVAPHPLLTDLDRAHLREVSERLTHAVEELDLIRERLVIAQEQLAARINEKLSRNTYRLSVVACVFLPLSLLTGLLGINVGGIPLADSPWGFWVICAVLLVVVTAELLFFRRMRWM